MMTEKLLSRYHKIMTLARETKNEGERSSAVERLKSIEDANPEIRWAYAKWLSGRSQTKPSWRPKNVPHSRTAQRADKQQNIQSYHAQMENWLNNRLGPRNGGAVMKAAENAARDLVDSLFMGQDEEADEHEDPDEGWE